MPSLELPAELVVIAWLKAQPAIGSAIPVATKLPETLTEWGTSRLFIISQVILDTTNPYGGFNTVIAQVDVWGRPATSQGSRPPYNRVAELCGQLRDAALSYSNYGLVSHTSGTYKSSYVRDITLSSGFVRRYDPSELARFSGDLQFSYVGA